MEPARVGRQNQRYDGNTRLVAGCLPVMPDGRVVLIGSAHRPDWILPKGGWELDETTAEEAAEREAYEEAGVSRIREEVSRGSSEGDEEAWGLAVDSQQDSCFGR